MAGNFFSNTYRGFLRLQPVARVILAIHAVAGAVVGLFLYHAVIFAMIATVLAVVSGWYHPAFTYPLIGGVLTFFGILGIAREIRWMRLPLGETPDGPMMAVPVVESIEKLSLPRGANFQGWNRVDPLTIRQAACLWLEWEPAERFDASSEDILAPHLLGLKQAVDAGRVPQTEPRPSPLQAMAALHIPAAARDGTLISRTVLIKYANGIGESPKFLFPQEQARIALLRQVPSSQQDFAKISFAQKWDKAENGSGDNPNNFTLLVVITLKKGLKNIAVTGRFGRPEHYISGKSSIVWRAPLRILDKPNLVSEETVRESVAWRPSANDENDVDFVSCLKTKVTIADLKHGGSTDVLIVVEIRLMCDDGEISKRIGFRFRNVKGVKLSDQFDLSTIGYMLEQG